MSETIQHMNTSTAPPTMFAPPPLDPMTVKTIARHRRALQAMDAAAVSFRKLRVKHWDSVARKMDSWKASAAPTIDG